LFCLPAFCGNLLFSRTDGLASDRFAAARSAYAAGDFAAARTMLERMLPELEETCPDRAYVGSVCLFLGAALEMLGEANPAVANYCRARELLGEGVGCDGLDIHQLRLYGEPCPPPLEALADEKMPPVMTDAGPGAGFVLARVAYDEGDFTAAGTILEELIAGPAFAETPDAFKGGTYLLYGAVHEKLGHKRLSRKFFRLARRFLGAGATIPGLALEDFRYYPHEK
jgi:tetratricopeptide (TPR) repeat protein